MKIKIINQVVEASFFLKSRKQLHFFYAIEERFQLSKIQISPSQKTGLCHHLKVCFR